MTDAGAIDVALAVLLPVLAIGALVVRDVFRGVVFFIVLGLAVSLVWLRLSAPDIALAEAAVGAGITGVLFMRALGAFGSRAPRQGADDPRAGRSRWLAAGLTLALVTVGLIVWSYGSIPSYDTSLGPWIDVSLPDAGVKNPVTAVLLNFRGYDTLLEVAVLLVAALAVMVIGADRSTPLLAETDVRGPMLSAFAHLAIPVMVLAAGYLLWKGADSPGGAFQGAAVLAAAWLLAAFAGRRFELSGFRLRLALAGGLAIFLGAALSLWMQHGSLLEYDSASAKWWMLAIESGLLLSCAAILGTLVFNLADDQGGSG